MAASVNKWLRMAGLGLVILVAGGFSSRTPQTLSRTTIHPIYISVTEMEYNAVNKTLEISSKVFTDDLEKALAKANDSKVDMYNPPNKVLLEKQIASYYNRHLQIKADGKPLTMEYVGYELEEQSTWSYYQVNKLAAPPKKIEVFNDILYEMNDKQINIIHITSVGPRKSTKLDYPATVASFEF